MSKTDKDLEQILEKLSNAKTEDEIIEHLGSLVKGFTPTRYIELVRENPYYTSVFEDVRNNVAQDIAKMKEALEEEIEAICKEKSLEPDAMLKLTILKEECKMLLSDLMVKESEIMAIVI